VRNYSFKLVELFFADFLCSRETLKKKKKKKKRKITWACVYFFISPFFWTNSRRRQSEAQKVPRQWDFGQRFGGNARRHGHNSQKDQTRNENSTLPVNDSQ
jgi:hypothetical protein